MKSKIIGIFVSMLLIGVSGIVIADWNPGDGHKMHFPQLPDPNGFDVDFGYWEMGDDWQCSETGTVDDIHFWISWFTDDPIDIPWIKCQIWSNEPNGPQGYSIPRELKWEGTFQQGQFIVAGPWDGQQRWLMPWGEIIPEYHYLYWQINIPEIINPFVQEEGVIYWLILKMPFDVEFLVGWKNTKDFFMDHAVWRPPGGDWMMIDGIDFAFVITGEPLPKPNLECDGSITWIDVTPGITKTDTFQIRNNGDPGSLLNWQITSSPSYGSWSFSPSSGTALAPSSWITITATCVAPNQGQSTFTGDIVVCNTDDASDCCNIPTSLTTPRNKAINIPNIDIFQKFPYLFPVLKMLLLLLR
jgi:hypothetical protein